MSTNPEHEAWNAMPLDEGGFDDDEYEEAARLDAEERDIAGAGVPLVMERIPAAN